MGYVHSVYTEPAYRRRGIARRIVDEMTGWSRAAGHAWLCLSYSDAGKPLYDSVGFVPWTLLRLRHEST